MMTNNSEWGPNEERAYQIDPGYRAYVDKKRAKAAPPDPPTPQSEPAPANLTPEQKAEVKALALELVVRLRINTEEILLGMSKKLKEHRAEIDELKSTRADAGKVAEIETRLRAEIANVRRMKGGNDVIQ